MSKLQLYYPIKPFVITQKFGIKNTDPVYLPLYQQMGLVGHNGWDIVGTTGQVVRAMHDGIISFTGEDSKGGIGIVVRTKEQYEDEERNLCYWKSIYWHLLPGSIKVTVGDEVKAGDVLAQCDSTPPGLKPHLHVGIKQIAIGEDNWSWYNLQQTNGYFGACDIEPYWNNQYAADIPTMQQIIILLKKVVELLTSAIKK